ncbi:hypothetical protein PRZ48_010116 [Zasmidium cellare]|uniref:Uncharacterized protein n=1 Tax=Zasmidium cellare TaxID=395010 RepID=A0ABR0EEV2_ZASCE|nr:hypothetical protein PRZ48_010116 [Zasmidium cellare]
MTSIQMNRPRSLMPSVRFASYGGLAVSTMGTPSSIPTGRMYKLYRVITDAFWIFCRKLPVFAVNGVFGNAELPTIGVFA